MDFSAYQKKSRETAVYPDIGNNIVYPMLGLASEAGEVAGKIKKVLRDDGGRLSGEKREALKSELGDVLWYAAQLATELKLDLGDVAEANTTKLQQRFAENKIHGSGDDR